MLIHNNFKLYMQQQKINMPQFKTLQALSHASTAQQKKFISNLSLEEFSLKKINYFGILVCLMDSCEFKTLLQKVIALRKKQIFNRPLRRFEQERLVFEKKQKIEDQHRQNQNRKYQERIKQDKNYYNEQRNDTQRPTNQVMQDQSQNQKLNEEWKQANHKAKEPSQTQPGVISQIYQFIMTPFKSYILQNRLVTDCGQKTLSQQQDLQLLLNQASYQADKQDFHFQNTTNTKKKV